LLNRRDKTPCLPRLDEALGVRLIDGSIVEVAGRKKNLAPGKGSFLQSKQSCGGLLHTGGERAVPGDSDRDVK